MPKPEAPEHRRFQTYQFTEIVALLEALPIKCKIDINGVVLERLAQYTFEIDLGYYVWAGGIESAATLVGMLGDKTVLRMV